MKSVAIPHFPRVIIENQQKWLFNPVLRKRFKNRPEERVRLKWVDFLLFDTAWKKTRIGFEAPVHLQQTEHSLRADLILYSENLQPQILIECKSESVPLNSATAEQAARYNTSVGAEFIILTNGVADYCFKSDNKKPEQSENPFQILESKNKNSGYWSQRGFCSTTSEAEHDFWIAHFLDELMKGDIRYLAFDDTYLPIPMDHYYRIITLDSEIKMAISLLGFGNSSTYLVAVMNEKGKNRGVLTIDLSKMISGEADSAICINKKKITKPDVCNQITKLFLPFQPGQVKNLPKQLTKFFD